VLFVAPFLPRVASFYDTHSAVSSRKSQAYEPLLLENEREAVADLLQFLESQSTLLRTPGLPETNCFLHPDRTTTNFFTGSPLSALTTLSFSDNVDLQRSAALAFAEITEKEVRPVGRDTLDPILFLLSSHDTEVQRAASAALGNLAVNSASAPSVRAADADPQLRS
jgi:vacuolar protein 8